MRLAMAGDKNAAIDRLPFMEELGVSEASTAALLPVLRYVAPFGIAVATW